MEKVSVACSVQPSLVHDVIPVRTLTNFYFRRGDLGRFFPSRRWLEQQLRFSSLTAAIDTETPTGRAMWQLIGAQELISVS